MKNKTNNALQINTDHCIQRSWNETIYGGDIDFFVEVSTDQYVWFALQAKLLKVGNIYDKIKYDPTKTPQWEKLKKLEQLAKCKAYYLLYNGNNIIRKRPLDICRHKVSKTQYGCSLVEVDEIERVAKTPADDGSYQHPTFGSFHPDIAQPWKILTCCDFTSNLSTYSLKSIETSMRRKKDKYKKLFSFGLMNDFASIEQDEYGNEIADASEKAGWEPVVKFIIPKFNF